MKFLKIISSSFHARGVREHSTLIGNPLGFFGHSQKFTSEDDIIKLLKFNLSYENKIDPGYKRDILIVSSNSKRFDKGEEFLESIHNSEIKNGSLYTMMRENLGYSYGAYNAGFQEYQDDYDFFIFQEDDLISYIPNYLKIAVDIWNETPNCGFVPFISATKIDRSHRKALGIKRNEIVSCHGGHGMSSRDVLKKVSSKFDGLPFNKKDDQAYVDHLRNGEIMFTYSIKKIGFQFGELPKELVLVGSAYDLMRGIEIKKNPHIFEIIAYYIGEFIKKPTYKVLIYVGIKK